MNRTKTINTENGNFNFNEKLQVKPKMEFLKLDKILDEFEKDYSDMQTGWEWLNVRNIKMKKSLVHILVGFEDKRLKKIFFSFNNAENSWSEKSELKLKIKQDKWLNNEIGKNRKFPWGTIDSTFDSKSCSASINVNYN